MDIDKDKSIRIGVIGGGAAGLLAAGSAAFAAKENGIDAFVCVLEKNEKSGKKIYITGKGRCNVTNDLPPKEFLENVVTNPKFLSAALYGFSPSDTISLLEENGTPVKTERGKRVFPLSDKASDITKALIRYSEKNGAKFELNFSVQKITKTENGFLVSGKDSELYFDKIIICTGGKSYPLTGSEGAGYNFAKLFGHTIIPLKPALVPIRLKEAVSSLMGLPLKNVKLVFDNAQCGEKGKLELFGEMLFTSDGITGPIVLSMSSLLNKKDYKGKKISIDLKPALSLEVLDNRILSDFKKYSNKQLKNALFDLMPKSLVPYLLAHVGLDGEKFVNTLTKEERKTLLLSLKEFTFTISNLYEIETGIVTSGGVDVKEVNPKSMESKLVPGLYFAGEVLDVDAFTGGFNLQIAFSTGFLAGKYSVS